MDLISNTAMNVTKLALDGLMARQSAIASNTANVETPDYQRKEVVFEDQLKEIISRENKKNEIKALNCAKFEPTSLSQIRPSQADLMLLKTDSYAAYAPQTVTDTRMVNPYNRNNVNIEKEMMDMAKTGTQFQALSTLEARMMSQLRDVISGGN